MKVGRSFLVRSSLLITLIKCLNEVIIDDVLGNIALFGSINIELIASHK